MVTRRIEIGTTAALALASWLVLGSAAFAGFGGSSSLSGKIWNDMNGDGAVDAGEASLPNVTVQLLDENLTVLASTRTDANGNYTFSGLTAGTYFLRVDSVTLPTSVAPSADPDGTGTPQLADTNLLAGQTRTGLNFGYRGTSAVAPSFECVAENLDGTFTAYFGYVSGNSVPVLIPAGATNGFSPGPADRGQTTVFLPGQSFPWPNAPFSVTFDGNLLTWTLQGQQVFVDRDSTPCSYRVNIQKQWFNTAGAPIPVPTASLPATFAIHVQSDLGTATCTYPAGSGVLSCSYSNAAPALDNNGLWVPVGGSYEVSETDAPAGASALSGVGTFDAAAGSCAPVGEATTRGVSPGIRCVHVVKNVLAPPPPPPTQPGTGTLGYWKTHPEAWPVQQITIGGVVYGKSQAISLMSQAGKGDKTYDLFKQLVAARLNVLIGNDSSCVAATITAADAWMAAHSPGSKVGGGSAAWAVASPLHQTLDSYNNGLLCAPHRN